MKRKTLEVRYQRSEVSKSIALRSVGFAIGALLFALCHSIQAQQRTDIPRVGYLSPSTDSRNSNLGIDAFLQGLRDLGYVEGKNIQIEFRHAEGNQDQMPALVSELVALKVNVLVVAALPAIRAAKQATKTIPIVMLSTVDPVAAGIVDSLARPG